MQSRLRLHLAIRILLVTVFGFACGISTKTVCAQTATPLPKAWNDAVAQLADRFAAAESPDRVRVDVKNLSSVDTATAGAIQAAFESDLKQHSFKFVSGESSGAKSAIAVNFTLSESDSAYVWVVQRLAEASDDPADIDAIVVSVPKENISSRAANDGSLLLEKKLIWKQRGAFLDFAMAAEPSGDSRLLVLEPDRLVTYQMAGADWQVAHTSLISQPGGIVMRDPQGGIDLKTKSVWAVMMRCTGDPNLMGNLDCKISSTAPGFITSLKSISSSIGTRVTGICGTANIGLFTGEGDWTQPDSIQGYLMGGPNQVSPSGNTIAFDGPVMALHEDDESGAARVVVHNLKTGNYEAYIVTATCNH
jgi:hypothetical protein